MPSPFQAEPAHFNDLYNWYAAGPLFAEAETLFQEHGDRRNALHAHIGYLIEDGSKRIPERIAELSDQLATNPLLQKDKELRLFALTIKGNLDGEVDASSARQDWEEVTDLAKQLNKEKWVYRALGQLGFTDYYNGDLASCERKVTEALIAATNAGDVGAQIFFLSTVANGLMMQQQWPKAIEYAKQAIAIAAQYPDVGHPQLANFVLVMAIANTGQVEEAKKLCSTLLKAATRPQEKGNLLYGMSVIAQLQHNIAEAIADLQMAIEITVEVGETRTLADYQSSLSRAYLLTGNLPKAEELARKAVDTFEKAEVISTIPQSLSNLASVLTSQGKYDEADQTYDRAAVLQDAMIGKADSVLRKTALITGVSSFYTNYFDLVAEHIHDTAKAYNIAEQARGRVLADLLLSGAKASPQALETEHEISELRLKLMKTRSASQVQNIRNAIFMREQERAVNPEVTLLNTKDYQPIPVETIQNSLSESEVIFEYVLSDPHSYCLVLTNQTKHIVELAGKRDIEPLVDQYLKAMKAKQFSRKAFTLYKILLEPIEESRTKGRFIVVRDGVLHLLPFDALLDERQQYVVQSKTVSYAPSSTSFYLLKKRHKPETIAAALLAVGGVPYGTSGIKKTAITRGYAPDALYDLPSSRDEVLAAAARLRSSASKLLMGRQATETAFKEASTGPYRYIHLAVHAFSNDDPDRAALVLLSDPARGEDGFLQASEIVQLRLQADLVVLSACETAVGPLQGAEGISTLSNAFLLAGARTVVSTLWPIEDETTLFLMKRFYQHLKVNDSPAEAMSAAKREMLAKFGVKTPPAYWAAFTVEGVDRYAPAIN